MYDDRKHNSHISLMILISYYSLLFSYEFDTVKPIIIPMKTGVPYFFLHASISISLSLCNTYSLTHSLINSFFLSCPTLTFLIYSLTPPVYSLDIVSQSIEWAAIWKRCQLNTALLYSTTKLNSWLLFRFLIFEFFFLLLPLNYYQLFIMQNNFTQFIRYTLKENGSLQQKNHYNNLDSIFFYEILL